MSRAPAWAVNLDARADLRAAIRRLIAAMRGTDLVVQVERRDLELLMGLAATKLYDGAVVRPQLDPRQR